MIEVRGASLFLILCAACTTTGEVRLAGQFTPDVPPPAEVRVMLDPHYGHANCSVDDSKEPPEEAPGFLRLFPDESGYFQSEPMPVRFTGAQWSTPKEPTFYLSFENEQDTIYAAGERHAVFQYRTFDAASKEEAPRAEGCWRLIRGTYRGDLKKGRELMLVIGPNYDSPKHCLPQGSFTPGSFGPYKSFEDE